MSESMKEMPRYKCHKEVWALRIKTVEPLRPTVSELKETLNGDENPSSIGAKLTFEDEGYAPLDVDLSYFRKHKPEPGGYYVVYQDGYKSCSPAKPFEDGYSRI